MMKKIALLIVPVLFLFSCLKNDDLPSVENITRGSKWGLKIGSSPEEIYSRLQQMGNEENFYDVSVVYRQWLLMPEEVQALLPYYDAITVEQSTGRVERAVIVFRGDTVNSIEFGGALPEEVSGWPQGLPDAVTIKAGDSVDELGRKLLAIYQEPEYSGYRITLPDKTLSKPFDPDMKNYGEWAFSFFVDPGKPGRSGRSDVRLYFKGGRLDKIRHQYNEFEVVY